MEVIIARTGVPSISDISDSVTAADRSPLCNTVSVMINMGVVIDSLVIRIQLIDRRSARFTLEQFDDCAVGRGKNRRVLRGRNVYRVMDSPL